MTPNSNLKLMTEFLDLDGLRVLSHQQYPKIGRILKVESTEKVKKCLAAKQVDSSKLSLYSERIALGILSNIFEKNLRQLNAMDVKNI